MTKPFTSSEIQEIRDELKELKFILENYDFEMNEDTWTTLYTDVKGYNNVSFSPVEFDDIIEDGVGIEVKKRKVDIDEKEPGDQIYITSLTRSIDDPDDLEDMSLEEQKDYYINAIRDKFIKWAKKVNETTDIEGYKNADIRWGTLLHSDDYARWAYWESDVEFPNPEDFFAVETNSGHLAIYKNGWHHDQRRPKYQPMTGSDSDRIETHHTIPPKEEINQINLKESSEPQDTELVQMLLLPSVYNDFVRVLDRKVQIKEVELTTDSERLEFLVNEIKEQLELSDFD